MAAIVGLGQSIAQSGWSPNFKRGLAAATPALVAAAIGALPPERSGAAAAFNNTSRQAGGALGVALLGGLVGVDASTSTAGVVAAILGSAAALLLGAFISWRFLELHTT